MTIQETKQQLIESLIGFNDRGIVEYSEGQAGLGFLIHGEWGGVCKSCGKKFQGKKEIETIRFGHVDCPSPDGKYLRNDITPEKIEKALDDYAKAAVEEATTVVRSHLLTDWNGESEVYEQIEDIAKKVEAIIKSLKENI